MKHSIPLDSKKYDLIVVPGLKLGPHWGIRKDLNTRLRAVIEIYRQNPGVHIAVCGKWSIWFDWLGVPPPVTECGRMKSYLLKRGVNRKDIVMESHSKDTIGNVYYLKRYVRTKPVYKQLLVVCAQQHEKRLRFLFSTFFGNSYHIKYLSVAAPRFSKNDTVDEALCLAQQKKLLARVRPGHEEDFEHELYNSTYYTHQASELRGSVPAAK